MGDPPPFRLVGRSAAVFGLKHAGKSNWTQWLLSLPAYRRRHLVYDVCREHDALTRYVPEHRRGDEGEAELDLALGAYVTEQDRGMRPDVVAVEEVSRFCGPNSPPPPAMYELIDLARHYGTGLLTVARRPAQVHSDITELADEVIVFKLKGDRDHAKLESMVTGLGDVVRGLDDYQFARVTADREVYVYDPVAEMDTTGRL